MCERSDAWYAVPANAERRKRNMRLYMAALVALSTEYRDEYQRAYRRGGKAGMSFGKAQHRAYAVVRDRHREEFRQVLVKLREA